MQAKRTHTRKNVRVRSSADTGYYFQKVIINFAQLQESETIRISAEISIFLASARRCEILAYGQSILDLDQVTFLSVFRLGPLLQIFKNDQHLVFFCHVPVLYSNIAHSSKNVSLLVYSQTLTETPPPPQPPAFDNLQFKSKQTARVSTGFSQRTNYKLSFRTSVVLISPLQIANIIVVGLFTQIYYKDFAIFAADGKQLSTKRLDPGQIFLSFIYGQDSSVRYKINDEPEQRLPLPGLPYSGLVQFGALDFTATSIEEDTSQNVVHCSYISIF